MRTATIRNRSHRLAIALFAAACGLIPAALAAAEPKINGRLEQIGPYRLLRVWGTPAEMGFAHGYLLGDDYIKIVAESVADLTMAQRRGRDMVRVSLVPLIRLPDAARAEIEAIYEGILERHGGKPRVEALGRTLEVQDLILHNAGDLIRAFACSGFTVWGERAGSAGVITGRNFDYAAGPELVKSQLILVREPAGGRKVATVTFPGYVGAFTGVNEDGVCVFMHDGTGPSTNRRSATYTPVALALAEALERHNAAQALTAIEETLKEVAPYPFSYMIRAVVPTTSTAPTPPARVFRIDTSGLSENPLDTLSCITTNHYMLDGKQPAANAGNDSRQRYAVLDAHLIGEMNAERAWNALAAVATSEPGRLTLHTLVVYPVERRLDLSFALWTDKIVAATNVPATPITFEQLFGAHD